MKIITKVEFKNLIDKNPGKRFVFYEYEPNVLLYNIHVLDGNMRCPYFGATTIIASDDSEPDMLFDYDWHLNDYTDDEQFAILEQKDIDDICNLLKQASGITDAMEDDKNE